MVKQMSITETRKRITSLENDLSYEDTISVTNHGKEVFALLRWDTYESKKRKTQKKTGCTANPCIPVSYEQFQWTSDAWGQYWKRRNKRSPEKKIKRKRKNKTHTKPIFVINKRTGLLKTCNKFYNIW